MPHSEAISPNVIEVINLFVVPAIVVLINSALTVHLLVSFHNSFISPWFPLARTGRAYNNIVIPKQSDAYYNYDKKVVRCFIVHLYSRTEVMCHGQLAPGFNH
jgi:hypothetical protein